MKKGILTVIFSLLLFGSAMAELPSQLQDNQCYQCHREEGDEFLAPAEDIHLDVHVEKGLACQDCHGGDPASDDPDEAMDPDAGFVGKPEPGDIPDFCGRCHSDPSYMRIWDPGMPVDQVDKYWTSHHGEELKGGNERVATCISCHDVHNIRRADDRRSWVHPVNVPETCGRCHSSDEHMAESGLPTNQLDEFRKSVHGFALLEKGEIGSPSCNDCHGNHGALPPEVSSLSRVCGTCHAQNQLYFQDSPHAEVYAEEEIPECEACHGNHGIEKPGDQMLDVHASAICLDCHDEDDGTEAIAVANSMHASLRELDDRLHHAREQLELVETRGVFVADALFGLNDARSSLIKSRTLVHRFSKEALAEEIALGMSFVEEAESLAASADEQISYRRRGLGFSTLLLTLVVILLWMKIRQMER